MSLNWNITAVKNGDRMLRRRNDKVVFETLILIFFVIGVNRVTEKAVDEIHERICRYENIFGPILTRLTRSGKRVACPITKGDLSKWIGLRTNVAPMSDSAFDRHIRRLARCRKRNPTEKTSR